MLHLASSPDSSRVADTLHRQWSASTGRACVPAAQVTRRFGPSPPGSEYDSQTVDVMLRVLSEESNGIDIGAAWGEILRPMVKLAGSGHHRAIEPLPQFADRLREEFPNVDVHQVAVGDHNGEVDFHHAVDTPAFSGIHRRQYPHDDGHVETFTVEVRRLDDLIDLDEPIAFIKIDVEGAEFAVLRGARECLTQHRPVVVFEYSGEETPGVRNRDFYDYLNGLGMAISTLERWLQGVAPLGQSEFPHRRTNGDGWDWMYVAYNVGRWPESAFPDAS